MEEVRTAGIELSVVMPCLNEADTVVVCINKTLRAMRELGVTGEVVVADNGSTDGSQALSEQAGARVVPVSRKGYGSALIGGIGAAQGRWIIMGDADDSYDFLELGKFVVRLREGYDLVQGCRLPWGGGTIKPGAMPFLHRWWGNPMFTLLARWMFGSPVHDIYCGLRGFRKDWQQGLGQRCTGMEFATEMLIRGSLARARIAEVPITLHPDGRKAHAPHLKTFRDGWRTLRFFFVSSPKWLFLMPGLLLGALGLSLGVGAMLGVHVGRAQLDVHSLLFASVCSVCGWQCVLFSMFAKAFGMSEGLLPPDPRYERLLSWATLERGIVVALATMVGGGVLWWFAFAQWWQKDFGALDYAHSMRIVIPGATLLILGVQTFFGAFLVSILGVNRR